MSRSEWWVGMVCAVALGVILRDVAQDYRDHPRLAQPLPAAWAHEPAGAAAYPAPAGLQFPLCEHGHVLSCADGRACRYACLPFRIDDPRAAGLEPERGLDRLPVHR